MKSKDYSQYDIILTKDDMLCVVLGKFHGKLIVHPKYIISEKGIFKIFKKNWERKSNPLDVNRTNKEIDGRYFKRMGKKDYLLDKNGIKKHFSIYNLPPELLNEKEFKSDVRKKTKRFLIQLKKYIPLNDIGITGSILLNSQVDKFSDIDLIIRGKENYFIFKDVILNKNINGLETRTKKEWEEFYDKYKIISGLKKADFANQAIHKPNQFIYEGIPVSTFFLEKRLKKINKKYIPLTKPNFTGLVKIVNDKKSMLLPAIYKGKIRYGKSIKKIKIFSENRAFISQATKGEIIKVKGFLKRKTLFIRNNYLDYIINPKWK